MIWTMGLPNVIRGCVRESCKELSCRRLVWISGSGGMCCTGLVETVAHARVFRSGRELAA